MWTPRSVAPVDTAGRVDKFQQRAAKTLAAQEAFATKKKKKA